MSAEQRVSCPLLYSTPVQYAVSLHMRASCKPPAVTRAVDHHDAKERAGPQHKMSLRSTSQKFKERGGGGRRRGGRRCGKRIWLCGKRIWLCGKRIRLCGERVERL